MNDVGLVVLWARAFALTLVTELVVAVPALGPTAAPRVRRVVLVAMAQLATHPIVWFVIPAFHLRRATFFAVAELWAVIAEAVVYRAAFPACSTARAGATSILSNAASVLAGVVARRMGIRL